LAGTDVFIGGTKCGRVQNGTQNGKWYTVTCSTSIRGDKIELKTTRNDYLSISGIEVTTGEDAGDDEGSSGTSSKISLENASMNKPYSGSSYKAEWALEGGKRTAITANGVGNWWKASFVGGARRVERVRVKNRHDCCGERLTGTKITIDG
jgi:hypothetical protein